MLSNINVSNIQNKIKYIISPWDSLDILFIIALSIILLTLLLYFYKKRSIFWQKIQKMTTRDIFIYLYKLLFFASISYILVYLIFLFILSNIKLTLNNLPVFASFFAICVAIYIPKQIAKKQNRIALHEKRLHVFDAYRILDAMCNGEICKNATSLPHWRHDMENFLAWRKVPCRSTDENFLNTFYNEFSFFNNELLNVYFLFSYKSEQESLEKITHSFRNYGSQMIKLEQFYRNKNGTINKENNIETFFRHYNNTQIFHYTSYEQEKIIYEEYLESRKKLLDDFEKYKKANITAKLQEQMLFTDN